MFLWIVLLHCVIFVCGNKEDSNIFFVEPFDEDVIKSGKWVKSKAPKYVNQKVLVQPAMKSAEGYESDQGLRLASDMSHYGIGTLFPDPLKAEGKDIVLQYGEMKCFLTVSYYSDVHF